MTSKWRRNAKPNDTHRLQPQLYDMARSGNQRKRDLIEQLGVTAQEAGISLMHMALAFVSAHPAVASVIIGSRTIGNRASPCLWVVRLCHPKTFLIRLLKLDCSSVSLNAPPMGSDKPLDRTYLSIVGRLKRAVAGIVPPKEVEDIVQETYVRACQAERESPIAAPRSFLFKTARNLALDHAKRAETRLSDSFDEDEAGHLGWQAYGADPLREAVSHEEFSLFCEAVRLLPAQCRRAFVLKKV